MAFLAPIAPAASGGVARVGPSGPVNGGARFSEVLQQKSVGPAPAVAKEPTLAQGVLQRMEQGQRRLDQIIASARDGKRFTPRELLSLQLEVFRITEELSLVNKVVEQGMAGIKRLWNLQV